MTTIGAERPDTEVAVILGVDTHLDFHVAVAVDHLGRRLGESSVPTTVKGYERLLRWAEGFGPVRCAGVEGTSSYGAGLARYLRARGIVVLEVERPERRRRSSRSNLEKSDPSDAERAARAVLAGEASGVPKSGDGRVEMIRALRAALGPFGTRTVLLPVDGVRVDREDRAPSSWARPTDGLPPPNRDAKDYRTGAERTSQNPLRPKFRESSMHSGE